MTLILTNHSGSTCYVYGYPGLAFFNAGGFPMATHLTWMKAPRAKVVLRPGGNAQAMLTWRVNVGSATPFNPSAARGPGRPVPRGHRHHREPVHRHVHDPGR
jgi:hypothetical protein